MLERASELSKLDVKKWRRFPKRLQGGAILAPLFFSVHIWRSPLCDILFKIKGDLLQMVQQVQHGDLLKQVQQGDSISQLEEISLQDSTAGPAG